MRYRLCLLSLLLILAGCGIGDDTRNVNVTALPTLHFDPVETLVVAESCDNTQALEAWLQVIDTHLLSYNDMLDTALDSTVFDMREDVMYMADLRAYAAGIPAPDCAADTQRNVIAAMTTTINLLTDYANGETGELVPLVEQSRQALGNVRPEVDALIERLDAQR